MVEVSGITLSEGTLSPSFDPEVTEYSAEVDGSVSEITVTVDADAGFSVTVNGTDVTVGQVTTISIVPGDNVVTIAVTDGTDSVTYTLTITQLVPKIVVQGPTSPGGADIVLTSGDMIDFDFVGPDSEQTSIQFTIENAGGADLVLSGVPLVTLAPTSPGPDVYDVPTQPAEATIPPGSSTIFVVRLTSDGNTSGDGERTTTLTVSNNDPEDDTFQLSLTGFVSSSSP